MSDTPTERDPDKSQPAEDQPGSSGEPGAEGGEHSEDRDTPPGLPSGDDDSALGDTDQHSGAQA